MSTGRKAPPLHFLFSHRTLSASSEQDLEIEAKQLPEFDGKKVHIRGVWYAVAFLSAESKSLVDFPPFVFQPEPVATNGMYMLLQFRYNISAISVVCVCITSLLALTPSPLQCLA